MDAMDWNAHGDVRERRRRLLSSGTHGTCGKTSTEILLTRQPYALACRSYSLMSVLGIVVLQAAKWATARESVAVGWGDVRHRRGNGNIYGCKDCAKRVESGKPETR